MVALLVREGEAVGADRPTAPAPARARRGRSCSRGRRPPCCWSARGAAGVWLQTRAAAGLRRVAPGDGAERSRRRRQDRIRRPPPVRPLERARTRRRRRAPRCAADSWSRARGGTRGRTGRSSTGRPWRAWTPTTSPSRSTTARRSGRSARPRRRCPYPADAAPLPRGREVVVEVAAQGPLGRVEGRVTTRAATAGRGGVPPPSVARIRAAAGRRPGGPARGPLRASQRAAARGGDAPRARTSRRPPPTRSRAATLAHVERRLGLSARVRCDAEGAHPRGDGCSSRALLAVPVPRRRPPATRCTAGTRDRGARGRAGLPGLPRRLPRVGPGDDDEDRLGADARRGDRAGRVARFARARVPRDAGGARGLPASRARVRGAERGTRPPAARRTLLAAREAFDRADLEREASASRTTYRALARTDKTRRTAKPTSPRSRSATPTSAPRAPASPRATCRVERGRCLRLLRRDDEALRAAEHGAGVARRRFRGRSARRGRARLRGARVPPARGLGPRGRGDARDRAHPPRHRRPRAGVEGRAGVSRLLRRAARLRRRAGGARRPRRTRARPAATTSCGHALLAEATVRGLRGRGAEVVRLATEAAALFRKAGDASGEADGLETLATEHVLHDRFAEALLACDRAAEALGRTSERRGRRVHVDEPRHRAPPPRAVGPRARGPAPRARRGGTLRPAGAVGLARGNLGLVEADLGSRRSARRSSGRWWRSARHGDREGALETELALGSHLARDTATAAAGPPAPRGARPRRRGAWATRSGSPSRSTRWPRGGAPGGPRRRRSARRGGGGDLREPRRALACARRAFRN